MMGPMEYRRRMLEKIKGHKESGYCMLCQKEVYFKDGKCISCQEKKNVNKKK
jgi:hypothetical protein